MQDMMWKPGKYGRSVDVYLVDIEADCDTNALFLIPNLICGRALSHDLGVGDVKTDAADRLLV